MNTAAPGRTGAKGWVLLGGAICAEVTGSLSLKAALDPPGWYALILVAYLVSFVGLGMVLRVGVPLGKAYGTWGAGGVALTAIFGSLIFGEPITDLMVLGIVLVIAGVLLVELGSLAKVPVDPGPGPESRSAAAPHPDATERGA